jgi:hypothetical protein
MAVASEWAAKASDLSMGGSVIRLRFNTLQQSSHAALGPAPYFRVEGLLLRQGPDNEIVAAYRQLHWEVNGLHLSSYECRDRARVHFEDEHGRVSEPFGPFDRLHFPNGSCYADDRRFAELVEETACWVRCADGGRQWPAMVISPA